MKIGILTCEQYENRQKDTVGSSKIRGRWLIDHWPEAEMFKIGVPYDVVIFQKAYHIPFLKVYDKIKIFDMCDPDWIDGKPVKEAIDLCDAVTTSSEELANFVRQITDKPVLCIPDRVNLSEHKQKKVHEGKATRAVWFGYSSNHQVLDSALQTLKRLGMSLTVISELPYYPAPKFQTVDEQWIRENVKNIKFDKDTINDDIIESGDVVLNPKIEHGRFKFKSDNKTFISWALGMPVAKDSDDIERFIDPEERKKEAELRVKEVEELWSTEKSVEQYKKLINELADKKL